MPYYSSKFMLMVSKHRPKVEYMGFIIKGGFCYNPANNGEKLWVKFIPVNT